MYSKNTENDNNHVISIDKELISADMLALNLPHILTPGFEISDFMANSCIFNIDKYNAFLNLRSYMCKQLKLMVDFYNRWSEN